MRILYRLWVWLGRKFDLLPTLNEAPIMIRGVTRFEVIDHRKAAPEVGRAYHAMPCYVSLSFQDQGRTLKVFVDDREDIVAALNTWSISDSTKAW